MGGGEEEAGGDAGAIKFWEQRQVPAGWEAGFHPEIALSNPQSRAIIRRRSKNRLFKRKEDKTWQT